MAESVPAHPTREDAARHAYLKVSPVGNCSALDAALAAADEWDAEHADGIEKHIWTHGWKGEPLAAGTATAPAPISDETRKSAAILYLTDSLALRDRLLEEAAETLEWIESALDGRTDQDAQRFRSVARRLREHLGESSRG